jgi:hypothetical protein
LDARRASDYCAAASVNLDHMVREKSKLRRLLLADLNTLDKKAKQQLKKGEKKEKTLNQSKKKGLF